MSTATHSREQVRQHFECIALRDDLRRVDDVLADEWLHPLELAELARLRDESRREAWRGGRWVAKQLVRQALEPQSCEPSSIAVVSRNAAGESVRPQAIVEGEFLPWSLSISHHERLVVVYLETVSSTTVGIDVVSRQPLKPGFLQTWFTANERQSLEAGTDLPALIWAAKEAVYKAINEGERFAPRKFEVVPSASGDWKVSYCGRELDCEIETRVLADDVIVIARNHR